jgi:hypothetical protein
MAEKNESTENGLWAAAMQHPAIKKMEALDEESEEKIKTAIKLFCAESFTDFIQNIFSMYAILLLEIKNQKDAQEIDKIEPDMAKLEKMGAENADHFQMLVEIMRSVLKDVDWGYVAKKVTRAGKKSGKKKQPKSGDESGPFSVN